MPDPVPLLHFEEPWEPLEERVDDEVVSHFSGTCVLQLPASILQRENANCQNAFGAEAPPTGHKTQDTGAGRCSVWQPLLTLSPHASNQQRCVAVEVQTTNLYGHYSAVPSTSGG